MGESNIKNTTIKKSVAYSS